MVGSIGGPVWSRCVRGGLLVAFGDAATDSVSGGRAGRCGWRVRACRLPRRLGRLLTQNEVDGIVVQALGQVRLHVSWPGSDQTGACWIILIDWPIVVCAAPRVWPIIATISYGRPILAWLLGPSSHDHNRLTERVLRPFPNPSSLTTGKATLHHTTPHHIAPLQS